MGKSLFVKTRNSHQLSIPLPGLLMVTMALKKMNLLDRLKGNAVSDIQELFLCERLVYSVLRENCAKWKGNDKEKLSVAG